MLRSTVALAASILVLGGAASAQDYPASVAPSPGIPGAQAVNPAPDAPGPYVGDGAGRFYDPMERRKALAGRIDAALSSGAMSRHDARLARAQLDRVQAQANTQRARHGGDLRDWDRERLNDMMNHLVTRYPVLAGQAG